ncbi:MAG: hypothetical protein EZS28_002425 [Streblomastix strix]|uniref:PPM-type phosphatase domain-containing protein n=1 Tax=Streblomastix strix TaxID=222440 RepID=A0A5J4X497_9EUKA|nr:MAG: hypothetical protein EZS28_002425 [Streblomastix strix]
MNQNCKVSAAGFSIIGDGRYSYNQDTYDIRLNFIPEIPGSFYAGVFDGHGGLNFTEQKSGGAISNFVKKTLPPILEHELRSILFPTKNPSGTVEDLSKHEQKNQSKDDSKDQQSYHEDNGELFINSRYVERAIQNAFQQTTQETKNFLKEAGLLNRGAGGTTAVVALLLQDELYIASVGDSIAFMCFYTESQISTIPLNRKHNWCWADESARIQQKGGNFHQQQSGSYLIDENGQNCLNMSRSMADFEYESQGLIHTPDITRHTVTKWRDFALLLASDGVSDIVSTKDCANILGDLYGHYVEAGDDEIIKQELALKVSLNWPDESGFRVIRNRIPIISQRSVFFSNIFSSYNWSPLHQR